MYFTYNLEVVLLIGSTKSFNYKYKMSKKYLHTIWLMAYVESTIIYNLALTNILVQKYIVVSKW